MQMELQAVKFSGKVEIAICEVDGMAREPVAWIRPARGKKDEGEAAIGRIANITFLAEEGEAGEDLDTGSR